jgi:hypothetical protein
LGDFKNCLHFIAMNGFVLGTQDVGIEAGIDDVGLEAKDVTRYCKADPAIRKACQHHTLCPFQGTLS